MYYICRALLKLPLDQLEISPTMMFQIPFQQTELKSAKDSNLSQLARSKVNQLTQAADPEARCARARRSSLQVGALDGAVAGPVDPAARDAVGVVKADNSEER